MVAKICQCNQLTRSAFVSSNVLPSRLLHVRVKPWSRVRHGYALVPSVQAPCNAHRPLATAQELCSFVSCQGPRRASAKTDIALYCTILHCYALTYATMHCYALLFKFHVPIPSCFRTEVLLLLAPECAAPYDSGRCSKGQRQQVFAAGKSPASALDIVCES